MPAEPSEECRFCGGAEIVLDPVLFRQVDCFCVKQQRVESTDES